MRRKIDNIFSKLFIVFILFIGLFSCQTRINSFVNIKEDGPIVLVIDSSYQLEYETSTNLNKDDVVFSSSDSCVEINNVGLVVAKSIGQATITAKIDKCIDTVDIVVKDDKVRLSSEKNAIGINESTTLSCLLFGNSPTSVEESSLIYEIISGDEFASLVSNVVTGVSLGIVEIVVHYKELTSNIVTIYIIPYPVDKHLLLTADKNEVAIGETITLHLSDSLPKDDEYIPTVFEILSGEENATIGEENAAISERKLEGVKLGLVVLIASRGDRYSNILSIEVIEKKEEILIELEATKYYLEIGESATLYSKISPSNIEEAITYEAISGNSNIEINNNKVIAKAAGKSIIIAKYKEAISNEIEINIFQSGSEPLSINLTVDKYTCDVGDVVTINYSVLPSNAGKNITFFVKYGSANCRVIGNKIYILDEGAICIYGKIKNTISNEIIINREIITSDPYVNVSQTEFYSNYKKATSYRDAYYRTLHGFMSGSISSQDQAPSYASYRPKENGVYIRNSSSQYTSDKNTYYVIDSYGKIVNEIYKGGAYVTLEEVAAYIFAFNDVPPNYTENKNVSPTSSIWGKYLRLNHSYFSGDTSRYPYEPVLPNIKGCGGDLYYYELDIGTTGTDCDPKYPAKEYNNGSSITRGAARIVYSRYDKYKNDITDINEKYLFYTYNHYNDFQEYLNYEGGWGEMFGNITGGGSISSTSNYKPTPYVETLKKDLTKYKTISNVLNYFLPNKKYDYLKEIEECIYN